MPIKTKVQLKTECDTYIKMNNNREITGNQMNDMLTDIIDSMFGLYDNISLLGMKEYDPTFSYEPTMGCFYGEKVYKAKVTTTGTFNINDWQHIVGIKSVDYAAFTSALNSSTLDVGITYLVKDINYYVKALSTNRVSLNGVMMLSLPANGINKWDSTKNDYVVGNIVWWNNMVFEAIDTPTTGTEPQLEPTAWSISTDPSYYKEEAVVAWHDFPNNWTERIIDRRGNDVYYPYIEHLGFANKIFLFAWGNDNVYANKYHGGDPSICNQNIISFKYNECIEVAFTGANTIKVRHSRLLNYTFINSILSEIISCYFKYGAFTNVNASHQLECCEFEGYLNISNIDAAYSYKKYSQFNGSNFTKFIDVAGLTSIDLFTTGNQHVGIITLINTTGVNIDINSILTNAVKFKINYSNGNTGTITLKGGTSPMEFLNKSGGDIILAGANDYAEYEAGYNIYREVNSGIF